MFILTFQSYSDIPQKRSEFYSQVFDTLFSVHDSMSKLAYVRERLSGLAKEQFEEVLRLFSFISFFEEKFIFPLNYLDDKLSVIKSKKNNLKFDNESIIKDLQIAIGILNKEGLDYTFPHRSLQEYFAASYIEKLDIENKKKLYFKLKTDVSKNYSSLVSRDHFFNLLSEIDYNNCSKFLSIPLVQEAHNKLKRIKEIDENVAYEYYGKILLPFYTLLHTETQHCAVREEIISNDIRYILFPSKNNNLKIPKTEIEHASSYMNIQLMIEKVSHFKECGDKIVSMLLQNIEDIEKSDEEIINLI